MPRQPSLTDEAGATGSWSRGGEPGGRTWCSLIAREYLGLPKIPNLACGKYDPKTRAATDRGQFTHARKILTKYF